MGIAVILREALPATRLVDHGCVLLRSVLDAARVAGVRDAADAFLREAALAPGLEAHILKALPLSDVEDLRESMCGTVVGFDRRVDALASEPLVVQCVEHLLGEVARSTEISIRNPLKASAQQKLHVEWPGPILPGEDRLAQALFYLDNVTDENGPTRVVPRSHRSGAMPPWRFDDPITTHADEVMICATAGDVLVLSGHLWHSGTGNRSGRPRRTIIVTYRQTAESSPGSEG